MGPVARLVTAETTASIPAKHCSTIKIGKHPSRVGQRERSLLSTIALFRLEIQRHVVSSAAEHRERDSVNDDSTDHLIVLKGPLYNDREGV